MTTHNLSISVADKHIHALRKARVGWVKKLEESNYGNTEALEYLLRINHKIDVIKSLYGWEFPMNEPTLEEIEAREKSWTTFVPNSEREF